MTLEAPVEVQVDRRPGDQSGLRQPFQRVGDGGPLGGDEVTEQTMRERKTEADPGRLDPSPAGGEVPEQEDQTNLEARLAADRAEDVDLGYSCPGSAQERFHDLRKRPNTAGEVRVQQPETRRAQDSPVIGSLEQIVGASVRRLEKIAGSEQLGRHPVADAGAGCDQSIEDQQARPVAGGVEPGREVALADLGIEHSDGCQLTRGDARADVELLGQVIVCVEQVGVQRGGLGRPSLQVGATGPPQGSGRDNPVVFDRNSAPLRSLRPWDGPAVNIYSSCRRSSGLQRLGVSGITTRPSDRPPSGRTALVCLAIPGQVVEIVDDENRLAKVDVAGVRRNVNVGLLDGEGGVGPGDWVLIHVGFAISQVDEGEARATRDLLVRMGADYEQELEQLKASVIE